MGAPANIIHNIRRGSSSPPSGRPGRSFTTETDLPLCCAWVWGGLERMAFFTPTTASSRPLRRWLLQKRIHNKNSPIHSISSRSCCPWRWWAQVTASQRFLAPRPIGETPVGECPGRRSRRRRNTVQLRPDGGGASSSAGERLAVVTAVRPRLWTAMGSRFGFLFVYYFSFNSARFV